MGQDESTVPHNNNYISNNSNELENIPPIEPLIKNNLSEDFNPDLQISSSILPKTYTLVKSYFYDISYHMNKNEETISNSMDKQYQEYNIIAKKVNQRKQEVQTRLNEINKLCQTIDQQFKVVSESLEEKIQRANSIAQKMNCDIPSFENF